MSFGSFFASPAQAETRAGVPQLRSLVARYADERLFAGVHMAFGHLLVRNSAVMLEALYAGGAEMIVAEGFGSPTAQPVIAEMRAAGILVLPNAEAAAAADLFLDTNALLGRLRTPTGAAEVTRTGIHHYQGKDCVVVSADDSRTKKIEGFFGTGDGLVRAWMQFFPTDPLAGKHIVQFGYGKIGRGAAFLTRKEGAHTTVVDVDPAARQRAEADDFETLDGQPTAALQQALKTADIILTLTGIPKIHSNTEVPPEWFRGGGARLVNQGAEDEFGPAFADGEILGGREVPLNFHLEQPTLNRYIDPSLSAHLLAFEALVKGDHAPGIHPLPKEMDDWVLRTWREFWPGEDLEGIGEEIGI